MIFRLEGQYLIFTLDITRMHHASLKFWKLSGGPCSPDAPPPHHRGTSVDTHPKPFFGHATDLFNGDYAMDSYAKITYNPRL